METKMRKSSILPALVFAMAAIAGSSFASDDDVGVDALPAPGSLAAEHRDILQSLGRLAAEPNASAAAAQRLIDLMRPHMQREADFVYPPLSLLPAVAEGRITPDMAWAIAMADRVKAEQAKLFDEHALIMDAVGDLMAAGEPGNERDLLAIAHRVAGHATTEAEVLEPTAILVGESLRQRLQTNLTVR